MSTILFKQPVVQKLQVLAIVMILIVGVIGSPEQAVYARESQLASPLEVIEIGVEDASALSADCDSPPNDIVAENCLLGNPSSEWDVVGAGDVSIQGFATDISFNRGETVEFKIDTTATSYEINIYRLGYYNGNGARLIATIPSSSVIATDQPACNFDAANRNLLDCGNWSVSASWTIPANATSGVYIARPTRTDNDGASHIVFIVRDDASASDLLFQTSDTTWQSYNPYGGYNAYGSSGAIMAEKLSYNRPFTTRGAELENWLFNAEYPMIRWLERNGYDVSYASAIDIERHSSLITNHKIFLSVGHDEYWSQGRRDAVTAARDAGVHLAFFSGNEIYWKTRWEDSGPQSYRTQVTYKEGSAAPSGSAEHRNCYNNYDCDPSPIWTGLWREAPGSTPENSLSGQISWRLNTGSITVPSEYASLRFWRNTQVANLTPGGQITLSSGTLGYEWDPEYPQYADWYPAGRVLLSTTNITSFAGPEQHHLSLYRAPSGALVFGAGTVQWSWGLDGNHDRGASTEDPNVQQATVNLFADMGVQPASLQDNLVAVNTSTDTTPPTVSITSPLSGASVSGGTVTITGTASDIGGVVGVVEISTNGGTTWRRASGRENWSYTYTATEGIADIRARAVDDSINLSTPIVHTFNVEPRVCPCSIWNDTSVPSNFENDGQPIEVGVKFQSSEAGYVTGLRFYNHASNTGTHTGHLWAADGTQLAEAVFIINETASGWQEMYFDTQVQIQADTTYVASYHSANGGYVYDDNYFLTAYNNSPLRALANGEEGPNGVYSYGPSSFPTQTYQSSNYWVDVIFDNSPQVYSVWEQGPITGSASVDDPTAIEAGFKFKTDVPGSIIGIAFYKGAANTGPFMGHLWQLNGTQLASKNYTNNTAEVGWQEIIFDVPIPIAANTTYIGSYFTQSGNYAAVNNYFTSEVYNAPVHALANNGPDGPNGVYNYGSSAFPQASFQGSNYWVDVLFVPDMPIDGTSPTITSVTPLNNATNANTGTVITAIFSEGMDADTITSSTFELLDASNNIVPASVSYNTATRTATLTPSSPLALSSTYTARVTGGASGVTDLAGNPLASNYTWTFSTLGPPPNEGPGGPILVLSSAANPFSRYYAEILRAEGLNQFTATDISNLTGALLNDYQVVILGEFPLTSTEVGLLSNWVNNGGNLIAMRPDPQLASLLGLTSTGTILNEGYILVNTASAPGQGIVNQSIQFHGTADMYILNGATAIAALYSNATTATPNPAVTIVSVGSNGGQAAAFTYDLARSVVYTRQGNPAWAGQSRDGQSGPIRADNLFFGNAAGDPQPDWIDFNKVQIPQADEQQRLLANMILRMNVDNHPLPRFWYFPRGEKAVFVMTHDEHGGGDIVSRLNAYNALSPSECNVDEWECVLSTTYLYTNAQITNAQLTAFQSQGHEFAVHIDTGCANFTPASLANNYATQIPAVAVQFPSIAPQRTQRTHCIAFSDWATQPKVQLQNGMRLDTNYYYWPPSWIQNRPGMFTGSGMPMRFADLDGTMIDVYQATTQMTDESGQTYPFTIDVLLDNAIGAPGYYGAFTANMHTDGGSSATTDALAMVSSALSRGVPVISVQQLLTWVDGRNYSAFSGITWNGNTLDFYLSSGAGANGLSAMLPTQSNAGPLQSITRNGTPVSYTTEVIKGIEYAMFISPSGDYQAVYSVDTTPPVISNILTTVNPDGTVTITWNTDENADSSVDYGTDANTLNLSAADAVLAASHSITLTGLTPNTTYYFRVTSADASTNSATLPNPPAMPLNFTTPSGALMDTSSGDFNGGDLSCAYPVQMGNGELILPPTIAAEFDGFNLPSDWSSHVWTGSAPSVSGGLLTLNGVSARNDTLLGPGHSLEFVATFGSQPYQVVGFGAGDTTYNDSPWIMFSTGNDGAQLYARILANAGGPYNVGDDKIPLGSQYLGSPHRYRIEWKANSIDFYIDGVNVASRSVTVGSQMRVAASDYDFNTPPLIVDWIHVSPYVSPCTFTSRVLDAGQSVNWETISWTGQTPAGTSLALSYRIGNTPAPDGSWTSFQAIPISGSSLGGNSRYIQYRVVLAASNDMFTPLLEDVSITYSHGEDVTPPTIIGRNPAPMETDVDVTTSITIIFSEPMDPVTIIPSNFSLKLVGANIDVPFILGYIGLTATLDPVGDLVPGTQYAVHVEGAVTDLAGNPLGIDSDWALTTRAEGLVDTTVSDFGSGTNACYVAETANGELILNPTIGTEFSSASLPAGWSSYDWPFDGTPGSYVVSGGVLIVDGMRINPEPAAYTSGRVLEFYGTFAATPFQHVGFGAGSQNPPNEVYNTAPWAMFTTGMGGTALMARTSSDAGGFDYTIPGNWLGAPHLYRIEWTASNVSYYIDGVLVIAHAYSSSNTMRPAVSDLNQGGGQVAVDWMRMSPYSMPCSFESRIFDAGLVVDWFNLNWLGSTPAGTNAAFETRSGNIPVPDESWSAWEAATGPISSPNGRYAQYRVTLSATDVNSTPIIESVELTYLQIVNQAPTDIALDSMSVAENQPINALVGVLSTIDPDPLDSFVYSLVTNATTCPLAADNASFGIDSANLVTAAVFDFETKDSYVICVRSTDMGGLSFDKQFVVSITDLVYGTTASISSNNNPSTYGQNVNFTVTVTSSGGVPTGSVTFMSGAVTLGSAILNASGIATFSTNALAADLSPYTIHAVYVGEADFGASDDSIVQTVNKATATITLGNLTQTYNGLPLFATATTNPPNLTVDLTYDGSSVAPTNAGSYSVVGSINHPNYTGAANGIFVIEKATSTTTVLGGGTFTYDGNPHAAIVTVTGAGGLNLTPMPIYSGGCSAAPVNVSDTPCTASYTYAESENYLGSTDNTVIIITPKTASVTPNAGSKVYGEDDPALTGTLTGFLAGDNVTATYSRAAGETVAGGPYTISAVLAPAGVLGNYTITYNTAAFTILPKAASVTPNAGSKVYGEDDPALTGTLTGFLAGDNVTATYSRAAGETVAGGPYTISAVLAPAGVLGNYTVTYNTAAFTITPKTASVTPNAGSKVYGSADPALTGTLTGFLAGDNVTATYSRVAGETVAGGPYTISAVLAPAGVLGNYTVIYNTAAFTITPKTLTITGVVANNKVYDGTTAATFNLTGAALVGVVAPDVVTINSGSAMGAFASANAGTWAVTASGFGLSGAGAGNYTLAAQPVLPNATITPKAISVTANAASKFYGAVDPVLTYTSTPLAGGDSFSGTLARAAGENVGIYAINQGTLTAGSNYIITFTGANLTVNPLAITVTADAGQMKAEGAADPAEFTYAVNPALVGSDTFSGALTRELGETPGFYAILVGTLSAGANYDMTFVSNNFEIVANQAPVITEGADIGVTMSKNGFPDKFALTLNATDAEAHTLTWSIQTQAGNGTATATGDGNSKVIAYAPTLNFSGADSFVVRVTDQLGAFDDITVNVTVSAGGDFPTFVDVPMANSAWSYIESIYYAGITGGCSTNPLAYCPNSSVTRAQMAIFLLRGMYGQAYTPPPATGTVFADVPLTHSAAAWIEQLAAEGITGGCGNGNYCPSSPVTRAQMAIFLLRAKYGDDYVPPAASGTEFLDVPIGHSAAAWIEQLAAEGITGGCGGGNYCPNQSVTRAQMAIFIQRTFDLARP